LSLLFHLLDELSVRWISGAALQLLVVEPLLTLDDVVGPIPWQRRQVLRGEAVKVAWPWNGGLLIGQAVGDSIRVAVLLHGFLDEHDLLRGNFVGLHVHHLSLILQLLVLLGTHLVLRLESSLLGLRGEQRAVVHGAVRLLVLHWLHVVAVEHGWPIAVASILGLAIRCSTLGSSEVLKLSGQHIRCFIS